MRPFNEHQYRGLPLPSASVSSWNDSQSAGILGALNRSLAVLPADCSRCDVAARFLSSQSSTFLMQKSTFHTRLHCTQHASNSVRPFHPAQVHDGKFRRRWGQSRSAAHSHCDADPPSWYQVRAAIRVIFRIGSSSPWPKNIGKPRRNPGLSRFCASSGVNKSLCATDNTPDMAVRVSESSVSCLLVNRPITRCVSKI